MFSAKLLKMSSLFGLLWIAVACEEVATVSIAAEQEEFVQSVTLNNRVDILWVIDNSGSMSDSQALVANNFQAFINSFVTKNYDFQMAVTTTEAYISSKRAYRNVDGLKILTPNTPNIEANFMSLINAGIRGSGYEKGLESLVSSLTYQENIDTGFPRRNSFFAVIIVSDEEDSSAAAAGMTVSETYKEALDSLFVTDTSQVSYSVSSIVVLPTNARCTSGTVGNHYVGIAALTNGVTADICDTDFASSLDIITSNIVELSTQFYLNRLPVLSSIVVYVNGESIPMSELNGWTYSASSNSILFHGSAIPPQGSSISIDFDPQGLIN